MLGWIVAALMLAALTVAVFYFWRKRRHSSKRRFARLAKKISRLKKRNPAKTEEVLNEIYQLAHSGIAAKDFYTSYQAIDLLKAAFGDGRIRKKEPTALAAVFIGAVRAKQPEVAAATLDAYRQILRLLPPEDIPAAAEQIALIAVVAFRERQTFLIAKTADILFTISGRPNLLTEAAVTTAAIRALRLIGVLVLRRRETGLFQEINTRLAAIDFTGPEKERLRGEIVSLAVAWLYRIIRIEDLALFEILRDLVSRLAKSGSYTDAEFAALIKEWLNIAGTASFNPNSLLPAQICEFLLQTVIRRGALMNWELTITGAGQVARLAVVRRGLEGGFPLILPLLTVGRKFLALELKFGSAENADSFRQQALFCIVRELLAMATFVARQRMLDTPGDVIRDLYQLWIKAVPPVGVKSVKRFCQLLLLYWLQTSRQAKKYKVDTSLAQPQLLSEADKQKLGFLE